MKNFIDDLEAKPKMTPEEKMLLKKQIADLEYSISRIKALLIKRDAELIELNIQLEMRKP